MGVVNTKSTVITNRDATPAGLNHAGLAGGNLKSTGPGLVAIASGDSIGSTLRHGQIPSNAYVRSVLLTCAATASAAADIGLYYNTREGGAVIDADFFASANLLTSALNRTEVVRESAEFTTTEEETPLWQAVGLAADPCTSFDIVSTLTVAATGAGSAGVEVVYCN